MSRHFILGVGGTGAKCVEAFVRLATCGLGPPASWVGLLDQDRSNGNCERAARVLSQYTRLHALLRAPGGTDVGASCPLFRTVIEQPTTGWAWAPEERAASSLSQSIGYPGLAPHGQAVAQALFSADERNLQLDEGFRQRPALGAALTLQGVTPTSAVWRDLLDALQSAGHGGEVRVFLIASIFGGTGAAGFPTVARLLRSEIRRRNLENQVKLGGALLLPYFSFPPPPPGTSAKIQPDSSAFMMQARGALEYYAALFRSERVFNKLYLIGCDPLIPVRTYSDGGSSQANPPLIPELFAALGAVDFLGDPAVGDGRTVSVGIADAPSLEWDDLPQDAAPGAPLRATIAATLRTAVAWRQEYAPALSAGRWRSSMREAWLRRLFHAHGTDMLAGEASHAAAALATEALGGLLQWFVALNRGGAGGARAVALLDDKLIAQEWLSGAVEDVPLKTYVRDAEFANFVRPRQGPTLKAIFSHLTYGDVPAEGAGIGRVLAALHGATREAGTGRSARQGG